MSDDKSLKERVANLRVQRVEMLDALEEVYNMKAQLNETYEKIMLAAHDLGVSNTAIARRIGLSETAVRLYIKRHLQKEADAL